MYYLNTFSNFGYASLNIQKRNTKLPKFGIKLPMRKKPVVVATNKTTIQHSYVEHIRQLIVNVSKINSDQKNVRNRMGKHR